MDWRVFCIPFLPLVFVGIISLSVEMMSAAAEDDEVELCASCGITGGDDIKLKRCTACHLVRYCGVKCQKEHRPKHKKECKKRAAELRDELLFKQPESTHLGDCPICCLPLPIDLSIDSKEAVFMTCCSKLICRGCNVANLKRELDGRLEHKCPFCRIVLTRSEEEINRRLMKRIEANDPVAICNLGTMKFNEGDFKAACEYWTRAAALGDVNAHYQLSVSYHYGKGVEKNQKKELLHLEQAAIGGHTLARNNLGCMEEENGRLDRAVKHLIIAAKLGFDPSLEFLKILYRAGHVNKEDFEAALRGHKAAIEATKSPQRKEAAELSSMPCKCGKKECTERGNC